MGRKSTLTGSYFAPAILLGPLVVGCGTGGDAPRATDTAGGDTGTPGPVSCAIFPTDNPWNTRIDGAPVRSDSATLIGSIGMDGHLHPDFGAPWEGAPNGIPYVLVGEGQPRVPVSFTWADESDPGPYPIPPDAPIEGGRDANGDRHVIVVDDGACELYELYRAFPEGDGASWAADAGATFDLGSNALRPDGWTSADAAGLPIFPGLVRYDEVVAGHIDHALRFTAENTRSAYIHPATHAASDASSGALPPMGLRLRLKASYDCGGLSAPVQVICAALKTYGMFLADNGSDWYLSGAPDDRWDDDALHDLGQIPGSAFDAVYTGDPIAY